MQLCEKSFFNNFHEVILYQFIYALTTFANEMHLKMGIIKSKGDEKVLENVIVALLYEHIFLVAKRRMAES